MTKLIITLIIWAFFAPALKAQNFHTEIISGSSPDHPEPVFRLPILVGKDKAIAKKVNSDLIQNFLDVDYGNEKVSIFEKIWRTNENDNSYHYGEIDHTINRLDDKVYSITLGTEGCAAYCDYWQATYSYDLKTGNRITLDTLFSEPGKNIMLHKLTVLQRERLGKKIKEVENQLHSLRENTDSGDGDLLEIIELYTNCIPQTDYDILEGFDFKINKASIIIIVGRCSAHYNRALDELWEAEFEFGPNELEELLNDYGKMIVNAK